MTAVPHQATCTLSNFEGPIDYLLYLIQTKEIDIYDVSLQQITEQFLNALVELNKSQVDLGAEFLSTTATLLWMKSKDLLPKQDQLGDDDEEPDPRFEIIHQLLDYCRFKQIAKELSDREKQQTAVFFRGADPAVPAEIKKPLGLDDLALHDLTLILQEALDRSALREANAIEEDKWRVVDKILWLRKQLASLPSIRVALLFRGDRSRTELIVTFLAILELMKNQEVELYTESPEGPLQMRRPELTTPDSHV